MKIIKTFVTILLSLVFAGGLAGQDFEEIKVPLSNPGKKGTLEVQIRKGPITVKGTARQDVLIRYKEMSRKKKPKIEEGKNGLKKISGATLQLEISEKNNHVWIETNSWKVGVIMEIEIPVSMDLKLGSYNQGDVAVDNVKGLLELTSYNGKVTATNISGSLVADTYNGKITATFKEVTPNTPMAFSNYNGGIDLSFPASFKGTMKIKSQNGEIYSGFDMALERQKVKQESKEGTQIKIGEWMIGKINGGGPEFTFQNYNGDIYIRKN